MGLWYIRPQGGQDDCSSRFKFDKYKNFEKLFLLLAYEHSEDKENVAYCLQQFNKMLEKAEADRIEPLIGAMKQMKDFAAGHLKVLEQFGRYPSRNKFLGRENTTEEQIYLDKGDLWSWDAGNY